MKTLIIIPAYNEADSILKTYMQIVNYNKKNNTKYDVIVINDGSIDSTEQILIDNNINHVRLINNLGIGGAVQTGYRYALENDYDIAIQFDGDGQHDIRYVEKLVSDIISDKSDMVIGSRFIEEIDTFKSTFTRRMGINLISFFIKLATHKKIYDTTSGYRAVNRKLISEFSNYYPVDYPEPVSTTLMLKKGYRVSEVSTKMHEREAGVSSIKTWKNVYYMINVLLSIIIIGIGGEK